MDIWDLVQDVILQPEFRDIHKWSFEASGEISTKSAFEAIFHGSTYFAASKLIWGT
jgi:hypothetical protein